MTVAVVSTAGTVSGTSGDWGGHTVGNRTSVSILCRSRLENAERGRVVFRSYSVLLLDNLVPDSRAGPGVEGDELLALVVVYPLPWPLLVGGVRCSRLWSTSQLLRPSGQQCSHSGGVCPQIQGRQCGAYVGEVEEMMCVVCVDVTEGA